MNKMIRNFIIFFILGFFMATTIGCIGTQPTPEDTGWPGEFTPQCCKGQETHTCGMPGMTGKQLPLPKGREK